MSKEKVKGQGMPLGLRKLIHSRELVPFVLLIAVIIVCVSLSESFRDMTYLMKTLSRYIELAMATLVLTMIVTAGMIDLSVPSVMCCSATLAAVCFHHGVPMGVAIVIGLIVGMVCGIFNGILIAHVGLPAMIVTIGTQNVFRGIAQIFIGDQSLGKFPDWFNSWEKIALFRFGTTGYVGVTILIFVLLAIFFYLLLHRTSYGRKVFAIGANERAAIYSGVNTKSIKMSLFVISGFVSGFAGILTMSRLLLVRYDMNQNTEVDTVVMVLLGGADINGGRGSMIGTFIAIIMVFLLKTGLIVAGVTADQQMFVMGLLLLVSVIIPNIKTLIQAQKDK
ncbi:MAG: ABC transporter permease [Lachnospiraceae bacterium]|jgi:rhamnose transport system permease protein|nr:ABC transporter permease [Lachnospiraceae bacterium]